RTENGRETWEQVRDRCISGLVKLGQLTAEEAQLLEKTMTHLKSLPAGRWLWVGGTQWLENPKNYSGAYNCTSTNVVDWRAFGLMMDLAMMGCGTGAVLEDKYISQLPAIRNYLNISLVGEIGTVLPEARQEETTVTISDPKNVKICIGDSREGWVQSYQALLELSSNEDLDTTVNVEINPSHVRPAGEVLKGFGGVANPVKIPELYPRLAKILNRAQGQKLNAEECCLLIDEAAATVVAGNIRRSAGIRQFDANSPLLKQNLWQPDAEGNWRIDPERDALRMANHTRVYHHQPTLEECVDAVRNQFYSGEGAIQYAPEAIARGNADLLNEPTKREEFLNVYTNQGASEAKRWLKQQSPEMPEDEVEHRLERYGLNPCVTAETWVHTENGARQVKDLIGTQQSVYVNGELFSTTPEGFFYTGTKPVVKLTTKEGYTLRLTPNHKVLKVTAQTQNKQYTEWVAVEDLKPRDRVMLHDHRDIRPWDGKGTFEEGWLLGSLVGDGTLSHTQWNDIGILRYWGETQDELSQYAVTTLEQSVEYTRRTPVAFYHKQHHLRQISSSGLAKLAATFGILCGNKHITQDVEQGSYNFYQGFLRGLFDADGSVQGTQLKGISVRLAQSNLEDLQAVQRMLLRLGIASTLYQNRREKSYRTLPDSQRQPKLYECQANHEIVIAKDNLYRFQNIIGFRDPQKTAKLADAINSYKRNLNRERFTATVASIELDGIEAVYDCTVPGVHRFDANGLVAHNCGEIIGSSFHCNLSEIHLNLIDPDNEQEQTEAFQAGALAVAVLLNHQFQEPRYQYSRELDPIVGVSFTGLFDFFVHAFGVDWLRWWEKGRPETEAGLVFKQKEQAYLEKWRNIVHETVWDYCDRHNIKRPNRCTTVQPSGTKSLLTGASPGWHPPKAVRFIRRVTFGKNDPVALACIDYGYSVVPSQSDKDENGNLLKDPFDERCTEWLVEIPVAVPWADLPGADKIDIAKFSVLAQFDFAMQVQKHYVTHNTSATLELREHEIEDLGQAIYHAIKNNEGYISAALLARFDAYQTFPRLPFEPVDEATYNQLMREVEKRRTMDDFHSALLKYDQGELSEAGPSGCDSDKCMFPLQ
ncbi:MAG: ribonucleoside-triphosphate reductase, adenosylcobalamin-dependent, partial [Halothece sp. Uz-M2-17]|nr:ribonucleoside-triphosphate reductase, adenosylcobalamin-dependent [Halothece sp. Uz-M2-17]